VIDRRLLLGGGAGLLASAALPALAKRKPLVAALGFVDVRDHGAKGDGVTIDSPAIDRAIAFAAQRGGGTVYFPPGTYAS
jgi:polygalacturonase